MLFWTEACITCVRSTRYRGAWYHQMDNCISALCSISSLCGTIFIPIKENVNLDEYVDKLTVWYRYQILVRLVNWIMLSVREKSLIRTHGLRSRVTNYELLLSHITRLSTFGTKRYRGVNMPQYIKYRYLHVYQQLSWEWMQKHQSTKIFFQHAIFGDQLSLGIRSSKAEQHTGHRDVWHADILPFRAVTLFVEICSNRSDM